MHITFLIGNGFDRNLGLNTVYSDFVKHYQNLSSESTIINNFRSYVNANQELWADAEIAMGENTGQLTQGEAERFSECYTDFCERLSEYLKNQMTRINYEEYYPQIISAFSNLPNFYKDLSETENKYFNQLLHANLNDKKSLILFVLITPIHLISVSK